MESLPVTTREYSKARPIEECVGLYPPYAAKTMCHQGYFRRYSSQLTVSCRNSLLQKLLSPEVSPVQLNGDGIAITYVSFMLLTRLSLPLIFRNVKENTSVTKDLS